MVGLRDGAHLEPIFNPSEDALAAVQNYHISGDHTASAGCRAGGN